MSATRKLSKSGESLYVALGIQKGSSPEEIKKAYRKMALRYHPDKNQNSPEATAKFQEINFANTVLSDETKRSIYDQYGSIGIQLAEQIGEDNVKTYMRLNSCWCKALVIIGCLVTGCCCCCCCCLCCNYCCGKCKPDHFDDVDIPPEDDLDEASFNNPGLDVDDSSHQERQEGVFNISGAAVNDPPVTSQPIGLSSSQQSEPIAMGYSSSSSPSAPTNAAAGASIPMPYK